MPLLGAVVALLALSVAVCWGASVTPLDVAHRVALADDFGYVVHELPQVGFCPTTASQVESIVKWAYDNRVPISVRGHGHSASGQTQSQFCVIDMSCLNQIIAVNTTGKYVDVQAGATWGEVFEAVYSVGHRVLADTDAKLLSVGGTLSIGGATTSSSTSGFAVHHVLKMTVVTGKGDLVECSPTLRPKLFNSILGGQGQFAVIVKVRVQIAPVNDNTFLYYVVLHNSFDDWWSDIHDVILNPNMTADLGVDGLGYNVVASNPTSLAPYSAVLNGLRAFLGNQTVDYFLSQSDTIFVSELIDFDGSSWSKIPSSASRLVVPVMAPGMSTWYLFNRRQDAPLEAAKQSPYYTLPRSALFSWIPTSLTNNAALKQYFKNVILPLVQYPAITLYGGMYNKKTLSPGPVAAFPQNSDFLSISLIQTSFAMPGSGMSPDAAHFMTRMQHAQLWQGIQMIAPGSKLYPFTVIDGYSWKDHYGADYSQLYKTKRVFDPRNILGRGAAVFSARPVFKGTPITSLP